MGVCVCVLGGCFNVLKLAAVKPEFTVRHKELSSWIVTLPIFYGDVNTDMLAFRKINCLHSHCDTRIYQHLSY